HCFYICVFCFINDSVTLEIHTLSLHDALPIWFGYGKNFGDYEFFQAHYLGGKENLRGYHNNRFAGRTKMFNNTELRFRIADFNTDRKSTRLNSSHVKISYAVFCLKKKKKEEDV